MKLTVYNLAMVEYVCSERPGRFNTVSTKNNLWLIDWLIYNSAFFNVEGHVALDRNPGPWYDTLLLRLIPGDLLSACPHRQFHTLPRILDRWAALSNFYPNAYLPSSEAIYIMVFGSRTHDFLHERQTR